MKSHSKSELAQAAGVTDSVFRSWLRTDREFLKSLGISPYAKMLPPNAVQYLVNKYDIDLAD